MLSLCLMKHKTVRLTLLLILFTTLPLAAQQDSCTQKLFSFAKNINTFKNLISQEKVYLHFDNTGYYVGETIWFKSYVVGAEQHQLSELSKILYVDLLSPEGQVVESRKLKIEHGQCHGEFNLYDSLFAGYYEIRAYTAYMLNFGRDCIFSRVFPVYDKPHVDGDYAVKTMRGRPRRSKIIEPTKKELEKLTVTFFPEGGNLIEGISSKVAFKVVNARGEHLDISGSITDSMEQEVTTFKTSYQGVGVFLICPENKKYTAIIPYKSHIYKFDLPRVLSEGYVMSINNLEEERIIVQIEKSQVLQNQPVGLSVSCRGRGYLFQAIDFTTKDPFILNIPKKELPSGVNQITLYNSKGEILSERLVFVNHPDDNKLSIRTFAAKKEYQPYAPIDLQFQIKDTASSPVETTFSLSVRDEITDDYSIDVGNIRTNLLLSSDLKGFIENPSYYFESDDNQHRQRLDLLLMTQGWRRYSWKKASGLDWSNILYPVEKGLAVDGYVKTLTSQNPLKGEKKVRISTTIQTDSVLFQDSCLTNENGFFHFSVNDFQGKATLKLQTFRKERHKEFYIPLHRMVPPDFRLYSYYETVVPTYSFVAMDSLLQTPVIEGVSLSEVSVKARKNVRNLVDFTRPNLTLDFETYYDRYYDQEDRAILERDFSDPLPYMSMIIDVWRKVGAYAEFISLINHTTPYQYGSEGTNLPLNEKIESIDIYYTLKSRDLNTNMEEDEYNAYFSFNTYDNDLSRPKFVPGTRYTTLQGYSYVKEFYSPQYKNKPLPNVKDFRRTLYWNPDVRTDSSGKASVHFYNNSSCKAMKISAETVKDSGILGTFKE